MLEHLILRTERGLCNRLRAIASAKRICAMTGARCTIVWDWGDYGALFDEDDEWISPSQLEEWERGNRLAGYHRMRHLGENEGGDRANRRIPTRSHSGIILTSCFFFNAFDEPLLDARKGEHVVLPWLPRLHPHIWETVDTFRRTNFRAPTAGIHMRRTDHEAAKLRAPDEAYIKVADRLVNDGYLLFLATDNSDSVEMMQRRYGSKVISRPKSSAMRQRWPRTESHPTDVIDDMVDLWLLAVCDFVIGSARSSFSSIATLLNGSSKCKVIDEAHGYRALVRSYLPTRFRFGVATIAPNPEAIFGLAPGMACAGLARNNGADPDLLAAFERLLAETAPTLTTNPVSVMDKPDASVSGNRHDYVSFAPYYWPNPASSDGMPYVRRDGQFNPEVFRQNADRLRLERMACGSLSMALCYRFTRDERYAQCAARQLRIWFVDPETCMTPHLEFSQVIPGHARGRSFGIIDGYYLLSAFDAAGILSGTRWWSSSDQQALVAWAEKYLTWLRTSDHGQKERAAKNNHGTIYDLQVVHLALLIGDRNLARQVAREARVRRIAAQIRPDGSQSRELARPESFRYSQYNLRALFRLAICAEHAGVDLWHYQTGDGGGIRKALDFLLDHLAHPERGWPEPGATKDSGFGWVLRQAERVYQDCRYREARDKRAEAYPLMSDLFGVSSFRI